MKHWLLVLVLGLVGCDLGWTPWGSARDPIAPSPIIVLASFDTTRVDALSAYGGEGALTPNIDALSNRGVRFEMALSPLPTTLGSHTSMMSGLDTHGHGVPRNGTPVPADVPLLAEKLGAADWDRIAVVGAMPLESDMGLDRGFRRYLDTEFASVFGSPRRTADQVTDAALKALDTRPGGQPIFLFVHYYDPHSPWIAAPQAIRDRFVSPKFKVLKEGRDRLLRFRMRNNRGERLSSRVVEASRNLYLAQVHWTDEQFGRLLRGLEERGLMDDSLVIMTADHGEMLYERHLGQIYTHGPDVDLPVTRVPLIIAGSGQFETPKGEVVSRQVRLQDLANTILVQADLPANLGDGQDLEAVWQGTAPPAPPQFSEATRTGLDPTKGRAGPGQWANANYERAIFDEDAMLVWAPWTGKAPKLYGLSPEQPELEDEEKQARLRAKLSAWDADAKAVQAAELDPETEAALKELGYLE